MMIFKTRGSSSTKRNSPLEIFNKRNNYYNKTYQLRENKKLILNIILKIFKILNTKVVINLIELTQLVNITRKNYKHGMTKMIARLLNLAEPISFQAIMIMRV